MGYKSTDGLMRHLRYCGIYIAGSKQKRQLINTGYYHGYKGYRFFKVRTRRLPFSKYQDVYETIEYDTCLKTLLYPKIMYIETAIKNIALNCILAQTGSENIQDIYEKVVVSYRNSPPGSSEKTKKDNQRKRLNLQNRIHYILVKAYSKNNPKITHFYNHMNYNSVPIWALFEILSMGDLGSLLSSLNYSTRDAISRKIGLNLSSDTNRELVYKYIYALKELRNAIAHNDVVFDTHFSKIDPTRPMKQCLMTEIGLPYVNFKSIGDYIILICYFLKMLDISKTDLKAFLREFERITKDYERVVDARVVREVVHPDLFSRMSILRNYI